MVKPHLIGTLFFIILVAVPTRSCKSRVQEQYKKGYRAAIAVEWCVDNEDIDGRNGCVSDGECLQHGRNICDTDPNCSGIAWYKHSLNQQLKMCRSTTMGPKTDGWRTMMKRDTCPSDWTQVGGTCFSPPRKTHEWKGSGDCNSNCAAVEQLCTDVGATLATKEEIHAWLDNGGDRLGMTFGLTSTMNGNQHWFSQNLGDYGWYEGCCDNTNRFFVCAKPLGMNPAIDANGSNMGNIQNATNTTNQDLVYGDVRGIFVYYQITHEQGTLDCYHNGANFSVMSPFGGSHRFTTYHTGYAECPPWTKGSPAYTIKLTLNGETHWTNESSAVANGAHPSSAVCNNNQAQDNGETGIDCGGGGCPACPPGCTDSTSWNNGYDRNCVWYANFFCQNGDARPGKEHTLGSYYNYPEKNCCVCGKDKIKECFEQDIDLDGNDLRNGRSKLDSANECQNVCQVTEGCNFFTFNSWGFCILKTSDSGRAPEVGQISGKKYCN